MRRRYLTAEVARAIAVEIANATFAARAQTIWGAGSTAVAVHGMALPTRGDRPALAGRPADGGGHVADRAGPHHHPGAPDAPGARSRRRRAAGCPAPTLPRRPVAAGE